MRANLVVLFGLASASACGHHASSSGSSGAKPAAPTAPAPAAATPNTLTITVDTGNSRPACAAANEAQLIYVVDVKQFQTCHGGTWTVIDVAPAATSPAAAGSGSAPAAANGAIYSGIVKDAKGNTLGLASIESILVDNLDLTKVTFVVNGQGVHSGQLLATGRFSPVCNYVSADCSGTCYLSDADIGEGPDATDKTKPVTYGRDHKGTAGAGIGNSRWSAVKNGCETVSLNLEGTRPAAQFSLPTGVKYPVDMPLSGDVGTP